MILLIDNYDSFVYNLARYVSELGYPREVVRNDKITLAEIEMLNPSHIIISPGPCTPDEAGVSLEVIRRFGARIPLLGVCLGHQAIGQAYGGYVTRARKPMHGKASLIQHDGKRLFAGLDNPLQVGRYHSLIVSDENLPAELKITAVSSEGEIMGLAHQDYPVFGVQFHPESVLTKGGHRLLESFLTTCGFPSPWPSPAIKIIA
jgi:anthranilate synthase/aminodeoxychorismate synthase-like glutamine amidotransferase